MSTSSQIQLLAAISSVQSAFILDGDSVVAFQQLLSTLLDLTESEFGFIGEIRTSEQGQPFLKTRAVTNIAWDQESTKLYEKYAPALEFHNLNTLFGHVITSGQPVISNRPDLDPRRGGLPQGHPPLRAFLGIPLFYKEELIGMIGAANRPGGYDEALVAFLAPFLNTCAILLKGLCVSEEKNRIDRQQREQTARLQAVLDNVLDGILILDANGFIETFNTAAERLFGYPKSEVIGHNVQILFSDMYHQVSGDHTSPNHPTIPLFSYPNRDVIGRRKDGSLFPAELSITQIYINDQRLFAGIIRDQTEQKRAQASLQESEQQLRETQALARLGSLTWYFDTDHQLWSEELYRIFGYAPHSVEPNMETLYRVLHPDDAPRVREQMQTAIQGHDCFEEEFRLILPDGTIRTVLGRAVINRNLTGAPVRMRAAFLDITAERTATHSREILTYAVDHSMEGVALLDQEGRYIYLNPAHAEMYGFTVEELLGKTWQALYEPEEIRRIERDILPKLTQSGIWSGELIGRKKSGALFDVEISLCLFSGPMARGLEFMACTCRDITMRKRAENTIKRYNEDLEARVEERTTELASAYSKLQKLSQDLIRAQEYERRRIAVDLHDEIGQALTALNINLQVLKKEHPVSPPLTDSLDLSCHILNQVRELAVNLRPYSFDEFGFEEALRAYTIRQAERNNWTLDLRIEGAWEMCADETAISCFRIVQESLTNAAQHANADSVVVTLTLVNSTATLIIEDNGIGFHPRTPSAQENHRGTGLTGMQERMDLAGGKLAVTSSPGCGTRIQAELPVTRRTDHS